MSELTKNHLVNRRDFIRRAGDSARLVGLGAALAALQRAAPAAAPTTNPWAYDDSAFRRTDPKLLHYHEINRFRCSHPAPRCLALSLEGRLFIGAGKYLTEHTLEGKQVSEIALAGEPRCVAVAADGSVYVGLREHLEVYDRKGQRLNSWPSPGPKTYFTGVAVAESDLFLADAGNRVVLRYDRSGKLKGRIGEKNKDRNIPGFIIPSPFFDIRIARDGLLRVTNPGRHCVETYTFDGDLESTWGKAGAATEHFCGCCNPINLALLADGRVVTFEKGIPRVKVYSSDGLFESVVAGTESFAENARVCGPNDCTLGGLAGVADAKGRIYILDFVAADVRVMEQNPA
jgi:hypothetical protein